MGIPASTKHRPRDEVGLDYKSRDAAGSAGPWRCADKPTVSFGMPSLPPPGQRGAKQQDNQQSNNQQPAFRQPNNFQQPNNIRQTNDYRSTSKERLNVPELGGDPPEGGQTLGKTAAVLQESVQSNQQQTVQSSQTTTQQVTRLSKARIMSASSTSSIKSDLSELRSSISEMKNLSSSTLGRLRGSLEDVVEAEPLVTFPESPPPEPPNNGHVVNNTSANAASGALKFEQKRMMQASKSKVVTDGYTHESASADRAEVRKLSSGDTSFQQSQAQAKRLERLAMDGVTAEKSLNMLQEQRTLKSGEVTHHETQNKSEINMTMETGSFKTQKNTVAQQQQKQTITSSGVETHRQQSLQHQNISFTSSKGMTTQSATVIQRVNGQNIMMLEGERNASTQAGAITFDDLERLCGTSAPGDVEKAKAKYAEQLCAAVKSINDGMKTEKIPQILNQINEMIRKAWEVPAHGHELGSTLCNTLRTCGGLDLLLKGTDQQELQFASASLLEQCLTTENRDYVVAHGLDTVVKSACSCTKNNSVNHSRVGTGILEHLFKHSEGTCNDVIRLGGLDAVLFECRKNDVETLRHCAGALANLSLYGGAESHETMIKRKVPMWLFPLAFHNDDNIKYYACLAIAALVANKEIEAAVLKSGTLDLVEPFITEHNPSEFANSNQAHAHGQSKHWLQRLVPVLSSKREEARNLASFHFCMEAGIKKQQGNTNLFRDIGAIEPLKKVASCPNAIASKFAAQALRLIGEEIPHKLSQQVPLWSTEDVREWVKQIGFSEYSDNFNDSRVDGDLLLQLTEENLSNDIGITNGIRRKRFTRELQNLKKMADYSYKDSTNLNSFLLSVGPEFSIYTYSMLKAGVDRSNLRILSDEMLSSECGIINSIHRSRLLETFKEHKSSLDNSLEEHLDKSLDVFISYRRSNGSQLASLLKVHLQLRGFTVFIDVERLEAGKFDNNLLQSIKQAKHFLLVLTPHALDRCIQDDDCKDWVHREIVAALNAQCNIVPITDNFQWPDPETLPEDMKTVCNFNQVMWIHDYQDACVDKLERFLRRERRGDITPGTPSLSHKTQPVFQRALSNMSADSDTPKD